MTYPFSDLSCTRSRTLGSGQWGNIGKHDSFPWHRGKTALKVMLSMSYFVWRSTYHQLNKFDFEILSLNTRGIGEQMNSPKSPKTFNYLKKHSSPESIIFLQETHSTVKAENEWTNQWRYGRGSILFSHGTSYSKGFLSEKHQRSKWN